MPMSRTLYRVSWVYYDGPNRKTVAMEVAALPETSRITVKHQVWLLLSQKGYDLEPTDGVVKAIGTEESD